MLIDVLLLNTPPQVCQKLTLQSEQRAFIFPLGRDIERYTVSAQIIQSKWSLESVQKHRDSYKRPFITASSHGFTLPSFGVWNEEHSVISDFLAQFPVENQINVSYSTTEDNQQIIQHDIMMYLQDQTLAEVHLQLGERPLNLGAKISGNLPYGEAIIKKLQWELTFDSDGRPINEKINGRVKRGPWNLFFHIEHAYSWSDCD